MNSQVLVRRGRMARAAAGFAALSALVGLAGCSGAIAPTPTAIPADVARPEQSTPVFSTDAPRFRLSTETPEAIFITPTPARDVEALAALPPAGPSQGELLKALLMNQPPSAMGITSGGVTLLAAPGGGEAVASVPGATTLTVTGRSADGAWLAAFTSEALAGWVPASSLVLFGEADLQVVADAFSPAPVATMLAEAMIPVSTPMAAFFAALTATPEPPADTTPAPEADAEVPSAGAEPEIAGGESVLLGAVTADGNVNLRATANAAGVVVASLPAGSELVAVGRSEAGDWLRVRTPAGDGWVAAALVMLEGDAAALPVAPAQ